MTVLLCLVSIGLFLLFLKRRKDHENPLDAVIFKSSKDAIALHSKGSIVKINDAFLNLFNYSTCDLDTFHLLELINFEFRNLVYENFQKRDSKPYFVTAKSQSGDHLHLELCDTPISKTVTCTIIRDLSPIKEIENETKELRQQVEHNQKLASIATVLSSFVHELNTPLTAIQSFAERLNSKYKQEELPLKILSASKKVKNIVEQFRQYSRDGKYEQPKHVLINQVVNNALLLLSHRTQAVSVFINFNQAKNNPIIWGNESQLESVIQNLISNSCDSFDDISDERQRNISIDISTRFNNNCIIKYSDNANGMSDHTINNMFQPFFTTKDKSKGTGLGMSLSKTIVEKHQGVITVSSTKAIGTTFQLLFPAITEGTPLHPQKKSFLPSSTKPRALVIDDQEEIVEIISFFIQEYFDVSGHTNPHAALDAIIEDDFDLIITDLEMPHISGLDIIDFTKANSSASAIVVISGHEQNGNESHAAKRRGADLIISKPFEGRKEFLQEISSLFANSETNFRLDL